MTDTTEAGAGDDSSASARRRVEAVWRIESARIVATLTRVVGDFGHAEDLAQEALLDALAQWPRDGIPPNPGAWLTTVAKRKAIDGWRRGERLDQRYAAMARSLAEDERTRVDDVPWDPDAVDDDVLRLVFTACHPIIPRESQVAMTLRVVGGLSTEEIARAFMIPVPTVQQRVVRAKKTIAAANLPFEVPPREEFGARLASVLSVIYLIFNEGYSATSGTDWMRADLADEAIRLARIVSALLPDSSEPLGLLALLELQRSRFAARIDPDGHPILLGDQDRTRWDHQQIQRGRAALARVDALGRGRGAYALQAGIAECHAIATSTADTNWSRIVALYDGLLQLTPSPVVELNRAVAVSMASGPDAALPLVDALVADGTLAAYSFLPSVRGELLTQLGRHDEARTAYRAAAELTDNDRERSVLLRKARTG